MIGIKLTDIALVVIGFGFGFERINESKPESKSDKYIKSIIQPNLRVILNPNPNPRNMSNP